MPDTLSISTAAQVSDIEQTIQFQSSLDTGMSGLSYLWTFGDGSSSTEAKPRYKYQRGGNFQIELKVSNAAGASRSASMSASLDNTAHLQGLSCSDGPRAGWCKVYPKSERWRLRDVRFLDALRGWAVGDRGQILRTQDGGNNWTQVGSGSQAQLTQVLFEDALQGWAIEFPSFDVLRTADGGATWTRLPQTGGDASNTAAKLRLLGQGRLLGGQYGDSEFDPSRVSEDGGKTWRILHRNYDFAQDNGRLWRVDQGLVSVSTDLGISSQHVTTLPKFGQGELSWLAVGNQVITLIHDRQVPDPNSTRTIARRELWLSSNGGQTWKKVVSGDSEALSSFTLYQTSAAHLFAFTKKDGLYRSSDFGELFVRQFYDVSRGNPVVLGAGSLITPDGTGLKITLNNGDSWSEVRSPITNQAALPVPANENAMPSFQLLDGKTLISWNWSDKGTISDATYVSKDLGQSWTRIAGKTSAEVEESQAVLSEVLPLSPRSVLVVTQNGAVRLSQDAGANWKTTFQGESAKVMANHGQSIWLSRVTPGTDKRETWRSQDGGQTWQDLRTEAGYNTQMLTEKLGWWRSFPGLVLQNTQDGGLTWQDVCKPADCSKLDLFSGSPIVFRDTQEAMTVSYEGSSYSGDGGKTWSHSDYSAPPVLGFLGDKQMAWAGSTAWASLRGCYKSGHFICQNAVIRSADAGRTWTHAGLQLDVDSHFIHAMQFFDARQGWIHLPVRGQLAFTEDAGQTWQLRGTPFKNKPVAFKFLDPRTGWLLGPEGDLYATGTAGSAATPTAGQAAQRYKAKKPSQ